MNGIEMLVTSIFKASGVDPEKVKEEVKTYGQQLAQKIQSMDESLKHLDAEQSTIRQDLEMMRSGQVMLSNLVFEIAESLRLQRQGGAAATVNGGMPHG